MPGRELLQNDGPTAGFYGEDSVGVYGKYGAETGADTGTPGAPGGSTEVIPPSPVGENICATPEESCRKTDFFLRPGVPKFGPKDFTDVDPNYREYVFNNIWSGELTYYDKNGAIGQCTQTWVPPGFTTVALNAPQFTDSSWCGTCVRACFDDLGLRQGERCFDAIIDNVCPECATGDLDLAESGDGRWPVEWTPIKCPERDVPLGTTQGSNPYYAKMKFEGGPSSVGGVGCFDIDFNFWPADPTPDGFWEIDPVGGVPEGAFRCGAQCTVGYTCCAPGVDVVTLFPGQFDSDGDGCPDSLDFITDVEGTYA